MPGESVDLLKRSKDPCSNPMGSGITTELGLLIDHLIDTVATGPAEGQSIEAMAPHLDRILDIQCAQDKLPRQAVAFVFELKAILRTRLGKALRGPDLALCFCELESSIDEMALIAFDSHARTQKKIANILVREAQRSSSQLRAMTRIAQAAEPGCGLGQETSK